MQGWLLVINGVVTPINGLINGYPLIAGRGPPCGFLELFFLQKRCPPKKMAFGANTTKRPNKATWLNKHIPSGEGIQDGVLKR